MEQLFELQQTLLKQFRQQPFYYRQVFDTIQFDNCITGVVGSRGVGKTTFLLHTVEKCNQSAIYALYIAADHVYFLENRLVDLVDTLYKETDVRWLCIDEIHKYPNWRQELKNIADFYWDFKLVFSGSSMIDIVSSPYDLSRRVTLYALTGLSFREYLEFTFDLSVSRLLLEQLLNEHRQIAQDLDWPDIVKYFKQYLQTGYFPFTKQLSQHTPIFQTINNMVQKTIYEDIATLHALKTSSLLVLEHLYQYVLHSQPGELSAYKLAGVLQKDYETIRAYLGYLEQAGLIRVVYKSISGKAALRQKPKIYPDNPNLIYASHMGQPQDMLIGKVRETFVVNQLQTCGHAVHYSETVDFTVGDYLLEVGGKNKTRKQLKHQNQAYILADGIVIGRGDKVPLYLLGLI